MAGEQLLIPSCEELDNLFREGREYFNEIYVKKMAVRSIYYNRVETETWPMNTAPEQRGFRFSRGWYDVCAPWKRIISERCNQNSCEFEPEVIAHPGTESYTWTMFKRDMRTDWYCITDWINRLFPAEEIEHIQATNANISKNVHEEFVRASFIGGSGNKWIGTFDPDNPIYCGNLDNAGWYIDAYSGADEGSFNLCYVYVKMAAEDLSKIAYLSLDMLDEALITLQLEDDAYRLDWAEQGAINILDIIVPDAKVGRRLWRQAKESNGYWNANTDFTSTQSKAALGVSQVIENYAFSYDIVGARFNADDTYNATLGAFNPADPNTWPRLVRVMPYKPESAELGCKWIPDPAFREADFGISVAWVPKGMIKWVSPSLSGYGDAQGIAQNFAGEWEWRRPDWPCNVNLDQGFFKARFRMGAQFRDPTLMHSFLHRLDKTKNLVGSCCPLNAGYTPPVSPDCYICTGAVEGES